MVTPARFGAGGRWAERAALPLRLVAGPGALPDAGELAALRAALLQRDEPGAALARALLDDRTVTHAQIRDALADPDAPAPEPLEAFLSTVRTRPSWVDDTLLARGAEACRTYGWDATLVLAYGSLLGGYRTAAALEPLVRTGRLTGGETVRRIAETTEWWRAVTAPGGLRPGAEGHRLSLHVRVMHAMVNHRLEADPAWDRAGRGVPINQYDQASTLGVFSTSFLLHLRLLGVRVPRADGAAVMHLWSYLGWLMGVDERWLPHTERQGRRLLYQLLAHDPPPDVNSAALADALIHAGVPEPRERALSLGTWLLGPAAMRDLGLTPRFPWYGLWRAAINLPVTHVAGRLPGGRRRLLARAERQLRHRQAEKADAQRPPAAG
ncbi:oxygenase MpaB family protein [Catenuloplanes japonicus]|uniref:oxygenase MpaB family protein n=1 Tax=Catenuloplanes japonicus TaxID=33876 RepID=UPI000524D8D9|nr:oxygenase MpaB family protein [Catenuloplanes japonicus]